MGELRGGRYVLGKPLGEGAQGETWEALDRREDRVVAIKAFRVGKAKAWKDVELAEREARTLASLDHPLLPKYHEHFEEDGTLYLVMDRIEGESLAALRKAGKVFGPGDVRRMLDDAARALGYLHACTPPIVHRDLKPGNVIRKKDGSFAFVDFGSVRDRLKLEGGSTIVGTFGYMAPEQFQGRASPATDVFGIGATALAMLTGREPEDLPHKGLAIDVASAVPPGSPRSLVKALEAMLDPDPDRRAPTIAEALRRAGASDPPPRPAERERVDGRQGRRDRRHARRQERHARRDEKRRVGAPKRAVVWAIAALLSLAILVLLPIGKWGAVVCMALTAVSVLRAAASARHAGWMGGDRTRLRIAEDGILNRVRAVTPEQAQAEAIREAERAGQGDAEAWADEEASFQAELWDEPESWRDDGGRDAANKQKKRR
jgi:hypothetical protein